MKATQFHSAFCKTFYTRLWTYADSICGESWCVTSLRDKHFYEDEMHSSRKTQSAKIKCDQQTSWTKPDKFVRFFAGAPLRKRIFRLDECISHIFIYVVPFGSPSIMHMPAQKTSQLTTKRMSNRFSSSCRTAINEQDRINAALSLSARETKTGWIRTNIIIAILFCSSMSCSMAAVFTQMEAHFVRSLIVPTMQCVPSAFVAWVAWNA